MPDYYSDFSAYLLRLVQMFSEGKIKSIVDNGKGVTPGGFQGLSSAADAVEVSKEKFLPWNISLILD